MQELSIKEVEEVSGGVLPFVAAAYATGFIAGMITGVSIAVKCK